MLYRPSCPLKNNSHRGPKGIGPFVRNMKATLGTRSKGYSLIFGTKEARQNNSSSSMLCKRGEVVLDWLSLGGGGGGGSGGVGGGGGMVKIMGCN